MYFAVHKPYLNFFKLGKKEEKLKPVTLKLFLRSTLVSVIIIPFYSSYQQFMTPLFLKVHLSYVASMTFEGNGESENCEVAWLYLGIFG